MFIIGNFIIALAQVVDLLLTVMYWLIIARAVVSWVSPDPFNPIVQFLYRMTEPVLQPFRRFLPSMALDLSPILAFFAIVFVKSFLVTTLFDLGTRLKM